MRGIKLVEEKGQAAGQLGFCGDKSAEKTAGFGEKMKRVFDRAGRELRGIKLI
jgi:hypothetical protein